MSSIMISTPSTLTVTLDELKKNAEAVAVQKGHKLRSWFIMPKGVWCAQCGNQSCHGDVNVAEGRIWGMAFSDVCPGREQ
jgi:hypothetical protein